MNQKTNIALLFPGQGSQYVGMGQNLLNDSQYATYWQTVKDVLPFDLTAYMQEGPIEELTLTYRAQPAIVAHSYMLWKKAENFLFSTLGLQNSSVQFYALGHSVGEYSALVATGALSFKDALLAVHLRGKLMQESMPEGNGAMVAITKLDPATIQEACQSVSTESDQVVAANYNSPQQTVISGTQKACDLAVEKMKELSTERFRAIPLKVSAAFHSPYMEKASVKLEEVLNQKCLFSPNQFPLIANVDAQMYKAQTPPEVLKANLVKQLYSSVLWSKSVMEIPEQTLCLEVGPGKALTGLVKKIRPELTVISLDNDNALPLVQEALT